MFWIPIMMAASALMNSQKEKSAANAQNSINKANTKVANIERISANEANAATGALNRMNQSLANRDMLRQGGQQIESIRKQQIALGEKLTTGTFTQRMQSAADSGALFASAGAAGVGGSTISMLNSASKLNQQVSEGENRKAYDQAYFAGDEAANETLYQMYNNMSQITYIDNIQQGEIVGPAKIQGPSTGGAILQAGMAFLSSAYSTGEFSKGGALDTTKFSNMFSSTAGQRNAGANYQIGARLMGD